MFGLAAGLYESYFSPTQLNILLIGEEGVGKTAFLERIKVTQFAHKREVIWTERLALPQQQQQPQQQQHNSSSSSSRKITDEMKQRKKKKKEKEKKQNILHRQLLPRGVSAPNVTTTSTTLGGHYHDATVVNVRRSFVHRIACPAPPRYQQAAVAAAQDDDDEEDDDYDDEDDDDDDDNDFYDDACDTTQATESTVHSTTAATTTATRASPSLPTPQPISERRISQESMESIDMGGGDDNNNNNNNNNDDEQRRVADNDDHPVSTTNGQQPHSPHNLPQYDMKPHSKMLPLDKIRPTSGMNLAKVEVCGCKCHVWDLCGRFQSLWERYYGDCDAVIFVVPVQDILPPKQQQRRQPPPKGDGGGKRHNDNDNQTDLTANQQQPSTIISTTLERVRSSIADDVPFLILGHVKTQTLFFEDHHKIKPNVMYSTESLLPHYHNPMTAMFMANAATGQGVKSAMEWLVPLAKRQKPLRDLNQQQNQDVVDGIHK